jgi:hypothetical protein
MDRDLETLYLKKTNWSYESEFRFISVGINILCERRQTFSVDAVREIVIGYNISESNEKQIMEVISTKYPKDMRVYRTSKDKDGRLFKIKI